jgi:hypothetical protein
MRTCHVFIPTPVLAHVHAGHAATCSAAEGMDRKSGVRSHKSDNIESGRARASARSLQARLIAQARSKQGRGADECKECGGGIKVESS